ncbi:NAD(+) synthase [Botrimarina hoheduenensis]|uniref:Glutamine-dependent NAD(+) synthetase n=1 Tax=Botrimarina hoheduenensis TaxID=2528000 RepID=A0A5C5WFY6_9BACT|nr:NAD(+) synthase [Botrimarina hoheduenensis]TWT48682.1 Glutamine-dependent NAD(+) synthetase [Botrimarina hoheduenensis]
MKSLRIAAVALNQTPLDWRGNLARASEAIEAARRAGATLVCLPELCLSGYGCEDAFYAPHVRRRTLDSLAALLPTTQGVGAVVGLPLEVEGRLYNAAACIADGVLLGFTLKQFLADDGIHYEPRWFKPWPRGKVATISACGLSVLAGDLLYDLAGVRLGIEICRDAWVADRPANGYAARGVTLAMNPSASHFAFGKQAIRRRLVTEGSRLIDGPYLYTNLLGNESGRALYEGGTLIAQRDTLTHQGPRFVFGDRTLTVVDVDVADSPTKTKPGDTIISAAWQRSPADAEKLNPHSPPQAAWETGDAVVYEEFSRAVSLALHDYRRKCRAEGFVLSLSGGADSAAVASLVWLIGRLSGDPATLETVYQATSNSGTVTRDAARAVATAVGATHHEWDVQDLVERYTGLAAAAVGHPLTWETDDLALQNIQSRVRSPGVWMLANLRRALLLTTGNRSEAAVGYATMDGDTSGGYAPIAGVSKRFVLDWLQWMETVGPAGVGPLPALAAINAQQPTAELRPPGAGQTDEADLMPYAVLDEIERSAIGDLDATERTLERLQARFPEHAPEQLAAWLERFDRLWRASQWKRERLAPSLHLDVLSVDPKTWRRWPILSGE